MKLCTKKFRRHRFECRALEPSLVFHLGIGEFAFALKNRSVEASLIEESRAPKADVSYKSYPTLEECPAKKSRALEFGHLGKSRVLEIDIAREDRSNEGSLIAKIHASKIDPL